MFHGGVGKISICTECKNAKSIMKLDIDDRKRPGLGEQFTIQCSEWHAKTSLFLVDKSQMAFLKLTNSELLLQGLWPEETAMADFCATMTLLRPLYHL